MNTMRRVSLCLLGSVSLVFAVSCGSGSSDNSGSGGTGGLTGKGGAGGDHATGGSGGIAGAGGAPATGGAGGEHPTGGNGGGQETGGAGGAAATGGAGGNHATGGAGGTAATGGAGGNHATGGAGGTAATGGAAGTSGSTGGGGAAGAGGHPVGGQGGGQSCAQLAADYLAALPAARACMPGTAGQCQQLEPVTLDNCADCKFYVNDPTALTPIIDQWSQQSCGTDVPICAIACIGPGTAGTCVATDGAAPGGICGGVRTGTPL
jgi:hypothetical protein